MNPKARPRRRVGPRGPAPSSAAARPRVRPAPPSASASASGASADNGSASGTAGPGRQMGGTRTDVTGDGPRRSSTPSDKDSTVTIDKVQRDGDGSYDASGTRPTAPRSRYDVSADLATITEGRWPRRRQGGGSPGLSPVTGDEAQKVIDAVKAKDSSATIDTVLGPDGSYDALGTTSDGAR